MKSVKFLILTKHYSSKTRTAVTSKLKDEAINDLEVKMITDLYELIWTNVYNPLSNELSKN
jgi:DNA-binding protein Fis